MDQNSKRIVMALQSGLKSELTWALNTLTVLSFKEKEDLRKDSTPLAKLPGVLDALLQVVDDWRDIAHPREAAKLARPRVLGANCVFTGFGSEYEITSPNDPLSRIRSVSDALTSEDKGDGTKSRGSDWWYDEEGLFNLDEEGRAERQQCAVAASNVIRNFSFMPDNESVMAQHRHCLETIVQCMEVAMAGWEALDAVLAYVSEVFCSPFAITVQIQGCLICLILALGWASAARVRSRELKRIKDGEKAGNSLAFLYPNINDLEYSAQKRLPRVSVVMPLKGFGEHNYNNWKSQLVSLYGGPLEFLFVVESTDDAAFPVVSQLISDWKDRVDAKVIVAGLSTTCSQKIHNQLAGVERMHKDSKYVLFLDDDVRFHPGSIGALTAEMERRPEIFIQTGYPIDIPSGSLGSYCIFEYHMPCSMGFATGGRTFFLWGGCMMMHADDFRKNRYGLVTGLRNGGYSDDMTLAAVAGAHKRLISSPPVAIFVHPLANDITFSRYWNYLRKQTFVLESYNSNVNWMMNRALFFVHCYCSWGYVSPFIMAFFHLAAALRFIFSSYPFNEASIRSGLMHVGYLAACTVIEIVSLWNITRVEIKLCNALSPEESPISFGQYNWGLIFIAMLVDNFLYPVSAFYSHVTQYIDWSGVRYHLKNGRIYQIQRHRDCVIESFEKGAKTQKLKTDLLPQEPFISSIVKIILNWSQPKKFDN